MNAIVFCQRQSFVKALSPDVHGTILDYQGPVIQPLAGTNRSPFGHRLRTRTGLDLEFSNVGWLVRGG